VASTLVNFALAAGGHDNVSVIVMPFPPAPYQPSPYQPSPYQPSP